MSRYALFCLGSLVLVSKSVASRGLENITVTVPVGSSTHNNTRMLCTPPKWTDVAQFFLANYMAHIATVKSIPGESMLSIIASLIFALLFPVSGLQRGILAIRGGRWSHQSSLQTAHRAGALCMVVRTPEWIPADGDEVFDVRNLDNERHVNGSLDRHPLDQASQLQSSGRARECIPMKNMVPTAPTPFRPKSPKPFLIYTERYVAEHYNGWKDLARLILRRPRTLATRKQESRPDSALEDYFMAENGNWNWHGRTVHGTCLLPHGYALATVPAHIRVECEGLSESQHRNNPSLSSTDVCERPTSRGRCHSASELSSSAGTANIVTSSYSLSRALIAIFQTVYASFTLYRTRGDQVERYGYAAFGLTVTPYLFMSIINLTGFLTTPDYDTMFLVDSDVLREAARRDGAVFRGMVGSVVVDRSRFHEALCRLTFKSSDCRGMIEQDRGRHAPSLERRYHDLTVHCHRDRCPQHDRPDSELVVETLPDPLLRTSREMQEIADCVVPPCPPLERCDNPVAEHHYLSHLLALTVLAVNGGLSKFRNGHSTRAQRGWTMTWMCLGIFASNGRQVLMILTRPAQYLGSMRSSRLRARSWRDRLYQIIILSVTLTAACAPAIGGFVVVAQMIADYGTCYRLY